MLSLPSTLALLASLGAASAHVFLAYQAEDSIPEPELQDRAGGASNREDSNGDPWVEVVIKANKKETNSSLFQTCFEQERKVWAQFYYMSNMYGVSKTMQYVRYINNDTAINYSWWSTSSQVNNVLDCANLMAQKNYKTWIYVSGGFLGWSRFCKGSANQATVGLEKCETTSRQPYFVRVTD